MLILYNIPRMPQVIFNSRAKGTPIKTFLIDFDAKDSHLFTWEILFDTIHNKYGVNINILKLIDSQGKSVFYKDLQYQSKFNINNHAMTFPSGLNNGDFWINFDIHFIKGQQLY